MICTPKLLEGDTRVKNGKGVNPHTPSTELETEGVEEEAVQQFHHRRCCVAVLSVLWK